MLRFRTIRPETAIVLLVEDLEPFRTRLKDILESAGLFVLLASSFEDAVRIAASRPGSIDLLLTRMRLQGERGPALAFLLRVRRPRMATLYISRNLAETMEMPDAAGFLASVLPQPFSPEVLLRRVSSLLAAHP